ncbi:MAG TPA: hypothetical protein VHA07_06465 [Devosia sp.]|nr:hypothetical protein [Devosia sp.]
MHHAAPVRCHRHRGRAGRPVPRRAADAPYTLITDTMHIHPTVSELLPTLFANLEPLD